MARGCPPQFVFVPTRLNLPEIVAAFDLAAALGCSAFVTGPLMRIGRAAAAWDTLACTDDEWQRAVAALRERAAAARAGPALSIYPWDIVTEIETRLESPQAMLLVVPNGKVKLLNALPFAPADLRRDSLQRRVARLSRRLAHDGGSRLRAALPQRAGAAAPRQRDVGAGPERMTRGSHAAVAMPRGGGRRTSGAMRPGEATSGGKVASARLTKASTTEPKMRPRAALATWSTRPSDN